MITKTKIHNKIIIQGIREWHKNYMRKNTYYAEETVSPLSSLKFQVLFMLVSTVAQSTSTSLAGGLGDGSAERGLRSAACGVEIRYVCSA
jgi:hypothetical protein